MEILGRSFKVIYLKNTHCSVWETLHAPSCWVPTLAPGDGKRPLSKSKAWRPHSRQQPRLPVSVTALSGCAYPTPLWKFHSHRDTYGFLSDVTNRGHFLPAGGRLISKWSDVYSSSSTTCKSLLFSESIFIHQAHWRSVSKEFLLLLVWHVNTYIDIPTCAHYIRLVF